MPAQVPTFEEFTQLMELVEEIDARLTKLEAKQQKLIKTVRDSFNQLVLDLQTILMGDEKSG